MIKIILAFVTLLFGGCSTTYAPLKTVEKVDVNRYLGTWYEIARFEHSFEVGCSNVSATYTLKSDGRINVLNQCQKENGTHSTANGVAYATDRSFAKLKVSFFRPFYGDYQILILDDEYKYVVIGEPSRKYFWILSRTKILDKSITQEIVQKMPSLGYDPSKLLWTKQN